MSTKVVGRKIERLSRRSRSKPRVISAAFFLLLLNPSDSRSFAQALQALSVVAQTSNDPSIRIGGGRLQIGFKGPAPDLPKSAIFEHIQRAAQAVTLYFGRFPVPSARVLIVIVPGQESMLRIGQHITEQELGRDWTATHELVHMSLASLPDDQHWLEEGVATYIEPIARAQAGQLTPERVWGDMMAGMHHGEPEPGDRGLNRTHTWGRTYWGGALFCLAADIEIRKETGNTRGLQDALRGIVDAGATIDKEWPVGRVLQIGDRATGTSVLQHLYAGWSEAPVTVDLPHLWEQLGVKSEGGNVILDDAAPLARIRASITTAPDRQASSRVVSRRRALPHHDIAPEALFQDSFPAAVESL